MKRGHPESPRSSRGDRIVESRKRRFFAGWDLFLIGMIAVLTLSVWILSRKRVPGPFASIMVSGEHRMNIPLNQSTCVVIEGPIGPTRIRVEAGRVWIEEAPCPHKLCIRMGKIGKTGECIVCIPNRIVLRIVDIRGDELDGVTM